MPPITSNLYFPAGVVRRSCRHLGKNVIKQESVDIPLKTHKTNKRKSDAEKQDTNNNISINDNIYIEKRIKTEPIDAIITKNDVKTEHIKPIPKVSLETNCDIKSIVPTILSKPDGFIEVDSEELDLERTLLGGQSFRWSKEEFHDKQIVFTGILLNHVIKLWRISDKKICYKKLNHNSDRNNDNMKEILADYFQLKYNLKELYQEWSRKDEHVGKCCESYKGFRILRQDPVENVFSFICATNNNIKRISQMVEKLCKRYGDILDDTSEDESKKSVYDSYYSFPPVERLAEEDVFQCLRYELGFGYRAKFINETAKEMMRLTKQSHEIHSKNIEDNDKLSFLSPRDYLLSLRKLSYKETCKQLMRFPGIGRKVADCICLMSMDHLNSVPIDCHIYEIVCRNYMPNLRNERKTLTDNVHDMIANYFNTLHGDLAGWSTSVMFVAELKHLKQQNDKVETKELKNKKGTVNNKTKVCNQNNRKVK